MKCGEVGHAMPLQDLAHQQIRSTCPVALGTIITADRITSCGKIEVNHKKGKISVDTASGIVKIVYFDEGSATDYVQLRNGGSFIAEIETTSGVTDEGGAGVKASVGLRALFAGLMHGSVSAEGSLSASFRDNTVVKSIVTNTVLTDFLEAVDTHQEDCQIKRFNNCKISQIPGSISSMTLLTPYLSMLRSGQGVEAGEFNISLDKLNSTLMNAKGYFEFLGNEDEKSKVILRFNGLGFKNNYKQGNLLNMNLCLYAVHVGRTSTDDLAMEKELDVAGFSPTTNPDYGEMPDSGNDNGSSFEELDMYDVILAGVVADGE